MVFCLEQNAASLANNFLAELRDVKIQKDRLRFRLNVQRIGEILAYELSKSLKYKDSEVQTSLGIAETKLVDSKIVLASVLRAGIPLQQGMLSYFEKANCGFIASYRKHHKDGTFEIASKYATFPKIDGKVLILCDSMIATGASIEQALIELTDIGKPSEIHVVSVIASVQGVDHLQRIFPEVNIWTGSIDEELTGKSYIVPGLGDAGDLSYGPKLQD